MKHLFLSLITFALAITMQAQTPISIPDKPEMVFVQGGVFAMGNNETTEENPIHIVTLSSYSIGKYPVTVGQYKKYCTATGTAMPEVPSWGWNDNHPMVNVNYNDALAYCNWLGQTYGGDWRLPTEAQWEFAARGGTKFNDFSYICNEDLDEVAKYADSNEGKTQTVGLMKPNELGIYEISSNIYEWCKDWYGRYKVKAQTNPKGATKSSDRVLRGGGTYISNISRITLRTFAKPNYRSDNYGFRVVLSN